MNSLKAISACLFGAASLAGCGGSSTSSGSAAVAIPQPVSANIQAGSTVSADHTIAANLNFSTGETAKRGAPQFSFTKTGSDTYAASIDGKIYTLSDSDRIVDTDGRVFGFGVSDPQQLFYFDLWSPNSTLDEVLSTGSGYAQVLAAQFIDGQHPNIRTYAVLGEQTAVGNIPNNISAVYVGHTRLDAYPKTGFVNNDGSEFRFRGELTLTADFNAGTISGSSINREEIFPGDTDWSPNPAILGFEPAVINGNSFAGVLTVTNSNTLSDGPVGSYSGGFYGPNAEEVAGVIDPESPELTLTTLGYFTASR